MTFSYGVTEYEYDPQLLNNPFSIDLQYRSQNGSLPGYITKRPGEQDSGNQAHPPARPRAPDEGGTSFGGYGQDGMAMTVEDTPLWQPCPLGYKRSKIPPFKCVTQHYYGADKRMAAPFIIGILAVGFVIITILKKDEK